MNTINSWRYVIAGLTAVTVMSFSSLSVAEAPLASGKDCLAEKHGAHHRGGHGKEGSSMTRLDEALELTAEQKQMLKARRDEQRASSRKQRKDLRETEHALHKAIANNASDAEIKQLAGQIGDFTAQRLVVRAKERQFLHSILTAEQKEKLTQLKSEHKHHWQKQAVDSKSS